MLAKLKNTLRDLKCYHSSNVLENIIESAQNNELSYLDFLDSLFQVEIENRKKNRIKRYQRRANLPSIKTFDEFDLIIINELGYLPLKPVYANLFFQLVNECYEFRSIMITSNKLFNEWGDFFGDNTIATAILDRLMHHCEAIVLNGDSYRLR